MNAEELEGLNLPELIDQLADVAVPAPVSYTPETIGWWVLAALLALGVAFAAMIIIRRRRRNQYRRLALDELQHIEARPSHANVLPDVAALVRRTALTVYPRQEVAHLYGDAWQEFLNNSTTTDLGPGVHTLVTAPYLAPAAVGADSVRESLTSARRWIQHHHA